MSRFARHRRVFFVEEPVFDVTDAKLTISVHDDVRVVVPRVPAGLSPEASRKVQQRLLTGLIRAFDVIRPLLWFYTPIALPLADGLEHAGMVYDCMDELSGFAHAPGGMKEAELMLLRRADVVFTGGESLYAAKKELHTNVHAFPSSVDVRHFRQACRMPAPADQSAIPRPRLGFCGVIDERMDLDLVRAVAERNPGWHIVMIGPVAKIDPASLPKLPNIHYLGLKPYAELPAYVGRWDVALMPFAHNAATRFISPTKTPEYLAAGRPVVSTSIRDVVHPYGERGCVAIADGPDDFCRAIAAAITHEGREQVERAEPLLASMSWQRTFERMNFLVDRAISDRRTQFVARRQAVVAW
jgi:glycosyltransferase involved in cell wall biosynthesis